MANMKSVSVYKKFWVFAIGILLIAIGLSSGIIVFEVIISLIGLYFVIASIMGSFSFLNVLFSQKEKVAVKSENLDSDVKKVTGEVKTRETKKTVAKKSKSTVSKSKSVGSKSTKVSKKAPANSSKKSDKKTSKK